MLLCYMFIIEDIVDIVVSLSAYAASSGIVKIFSDYFLFIWNWKEYNMDFLIQLVSVFIFSISLIFGILENHEVLANLICYISVICKFIRN